MLIRWMACSRIAGLVRACVTASIAGRISVNSAASNFHELSIRRQSPASSTSSGMKSACSIFGGFGIAEIKAINPNAAYLANAGGGALSDLDMKTIGELAPTLFADRQARRGLMLPWANGKNGKEYRATLGRKAIAGIFSVGLEEEYRWKDSVQSGPEIRTWVADGIAQGLRPWFTKFNAKPIDRRWLPVVEDLYKWHHENERYLRNEEPLARVAMVYSQQTATFYGGEHARAKVEDPALGYYQALVEGRIPFEMVHDRLLDAARLNSFGVLILPNIAALSTEQCKQIRKLCAARRQHSRYSRNLAIRRMGGSAERFRVGVAVWCVIRRRLGRTDAEFVSHARKGSGHWSISSIIGGT